MCVLGGAGSVEVSRAHHPRIKKYSLVTISMNSFLSFSERTCYVFFGAIFGFLLHLTSCYSFQVEHFSRGDSVHKHAATHLFLNCCGLAVDQIKVGSLKVIKRKILHLKTSKSFQSEIVW